MPIEILMPALSPTMKEGNLAKWVKKEGDKIKAGEVIAEIETDKATMEVEAVDEGILAKIIIPQGSENVAVNTCIALILEDGEDKSALDKFVSSSSNSSVVNKSDSLPQTANNIEKTTTIETKTFVETTKSSSDFIKASPLAKRIAKNENISLNQISGTGPHGRIVKDDILNYLSSGNSSRSSSVGAIHRNPQEFYTKKNNNIRKVIAKRLLDSKQNVPHFYLSCELRVDKLNELRNSLNEVAHHDENGVPEYKISINDLIIKATAMALKKVPEANSSWTEEATIIYNNIDISMAVAIDGGLITPIIKNADQKTIQQISKESKALAKKARDGKLTPEEFQGGTFSISNLGMFGIDNFSAIINPPQSCILAVSRTVEKPVIDHGQVKIGHTMNITLSADHRVVDGAVGAEFLKALRRYIEHPILNIL